MQLAYLHTLHHLFQQQTTLDFEQFCHGNRQAAKMHSEQIIEESINSQTNQTNRNPTNHTDNNHIESAHHNAPQQEQQQQTMQNTLKSLTGSQVLKIYADAEFFKQLVRNRQEYPRQIDQIVLRISYMMGQVLIQMQSNLIELGYLENSVVLSVKEIQSATYNMVALELNNEPVGDMNQVGLYEVKQKIVEMFEQDNMDIDSMLQVYSFMVTVWKQPLHIGIRLEKQQPKKSARPSTTEKYMQTEPILLHDNPLIPKASPKTITNHKIAHSVNNMPAPKQTAKKNTPINRPANIYLPPNFDLGSNLLVSQVTAFNPKQATPGKKAIQSKIKRAKSRIEAADKPLHIYNRKIRQKLNNNLIYDEQQQNNKDREIDEQKEKDIYLPSLSKPPKPNKAAIKNKTVRDIKLDAVKDKMAMLNTPPHQLTHPRATTCSDNGLNQGSGMGNKVMDLSGLDEKIVLDQNRNRIINKQMNGFRPAIINDSNLNLQQNIMKGSFGPNFNNKMMVPTQNEKRSVKPTQSNPSLAATAKSGNVMTFRQNNQQSVAQLRPTGQNQTNISIDDNEIIDLNPSNRPPKTTSHNHQPKPNNNTPMMNTNIKLQEKLEEPSQPKQNDKLHLPESILSRPTSIEPITIPIIAQDSFTTNRNTQNNNPKVDSSELQKENLRKMRERWAPQQEKILTQHFVQKGDQFQCSKQLQQIYGSANPKYSPPGVRIKIDAIVRKVHQKFCSLNTKNQNIRKFKQNWQFIRKKSTMAVRRRIYKEIVVIYTAMLNMSQQKRQVISSKVTEINRICQQEMAKSAVTLLNSSQAVTNQGVDRQ